MGWYLLAAKQSHVLSEAYRRISFLYSARTDLLPSLHLSLSVHNFLPPSYGLDEVGGDIGNKPKGSG